ncbi:MAG TPA: SAM-dependent methyltransferase [Prosthecobacter sp.]|nr:SAM-dependent methyltransferase [Prosthecobacter sp.]HRK13243.1 SAM-dependent methyltransferase [Prosthecobacter sp.]
MHTFLAADDAIEPLTGELGGADMEGVWLRSENLPAHLAFARQTLPRARRVEAASVNAWADQILQSIVGVLPEEGTWRLHLWPAYGEGRAGEHRCRLIRSALAEKLKKQRRALMRCQEESQEPFTRSTSLVQAVLTSPGSGLLSLSAAPEPHELRSIISAYPAGHITPAEDKTAPSRAFAKVIEAEMRLGRRIMKNETCVDLGASPGSWSHVALLRGAHVTAVDRSPLRADLMRHPRLHFHQGDAFKFRPPEPVDWLLCDIIAAPQRSMDLLLDWLRARLMRAFIVTIKFKGTDEYGQLDTLKQNAPPLCADFRLTRLCANKNEVCAFGIAARE